MIIIAILSVIIPFSLATAKIIKFYEAWLITSFVWSFPLVLIVITAYGLNKILDFIIKAALRLWWEFC